MQLSPNLKVFEPQAISRGSRLRCPSGCTESEAEPAKMAPDNLSAGRIWQLARPLLTYVRLNKDAIVDYEARYRSGRRIVTALAGSAVNSVAARRMVKKQQMRWSKRGAHLMLQVRAAVMNGNLREQLSYQPPIFKSRLGRLRSVVCDPVLRRRSPSPLGCRTRTDSHTRPSVCTE